MISMALTLAFLLPVTSAQTSQSDPTAAALAEINKGNLFEGVRRLKEITRTEPSSAPAYFYLSSLYTGIGHFDTAYDYLAAAMKANPGQGAYYHQLGIIRRHEGCRPEALTAFQQALKAGMGRDEATVWRHVGEVNVDLLAWNEAIEAYTNALRLAPDDARAHLGLGQLYLDRNEPKRALPELLAAQQADPGLEGVHAKLGLAYRATSDLSSAVAILKQGVERNPSDQESRYVLGQLLLTMGKDDEGRREMEAYRKLQAQMTQTDALFETAVQHAQAGELDRAEQLFRETLRLAPRYAPALHLLGVVLLNRGNPERALEVLQQASASNPLNADIYFQMASAYFRAGKLSEALDMTQRALILDEEDPRYYTLLGNVYSKMNREAEARAARERATRPRNRPRNGPPDPYASEMRRRDDASTVKEICGSQPDQR
jgi:eukaryotic-like serine/threonine-protein kinase